VNLAVFVYDFPHKKTQEFLLRLWLERVPVAVVVGAPPQEVSRPLAHWRTAPRHIGVLHPAHLCARLGMPYVVAEHNGAQTVDVLRRWATDLVVIAGARILRREIIAVPRIGIVNFHPGLIPEVRGLDALKWSVFHDVPPGVTAHLIDERVDAGWIVLRQRIPVYPDDSWVDLGLRLLEAQVDLLPETLRRLTERPARESYASVRGGRPNRPMPPEIEQVVAEEFEAWKARYAGTAQAVPGPGP